MSGRIFAGWRYWGWRMVLPWPNRGAASWCGAFVLIQAPIAMSRWLGRGDIGMTFARRTEKHGWRFGGRPFV